MTALCHNHEDPELWFTGSKRAVARAKEIFSLVGVEVEVVPVPGSEYPLPAARPANGVLSAPGSPKLRPWREALEDYLRCEKVI